MPLTALTIAVLALAGYGYSVVSQGPRHEREIRRTPPHSDTTDPKTVPRTPLNIASDCSSWEMPDTWIIQTAEPRFRRALNRALDESAGDIDTAHNAGLLDPVDITYAILDGEVMCPTPFVERADGTAATFRALQSDTPQRDDYYPYPAMLGLYDTIYEAVESALSIATLTGDPNRALLFPV